jgi:hyperosmotically inducible protein
MKALAIIAFLIAGGSSATFAVADQTMDSDAAQAGQFVKDSVITTKVKVKLAEKHLSTLTKIQVNTDEHGIVWLSGLAPTRHASDLAEMIAKSVDGVTNVHNKIAVEE